MGILKQNDRFPYLILKADCLALKKIYAISGELDSISDLGTELISKKSIKSLGKELF